MWYITFHGGSSKDNIFVYPDAWSKGSPAAPALLQTDASYPLQELRGFQIVDGSLYVLNAYKKYSQILAYEPDGNGGYCLKEDGVFASKDTVNSIDHPYDLTFDDQGNCYVSSQDTNVVTGLTKAGKPLPVAVCLPEPKGSDTYLEGTIVASSIGALPGVPKTPPDVPTPQGLKVEPTGGQKVQHSVRGVLFYQGCLYVADEPANAVKVYDAKSGEYSGKIQGGKLKGPVQLLLTKTNGVPYLYISSSRNGSVVRYDLSHGAPSGKVQPEKFIDQKLNDISGIAFDANGNFYAADRKGCSIKEFPPDGSGSGMEIISDLPDEPEFIRYVPINN